MPRPVPASAAAVRTVLVLAVLGRGAAAWAADDEVVVTQAALPPSGATVLDVDDAPLADDVADQLERATGAVVRRLGGLGAWAGVSLRGSSFRQVQIHLDGVPLNPDGVDAVNLAELPLRAFERLLVFRGRVPATYGASPIGGLVDLRTREAAAAPELVAGVGSYGSGRFGGSGGGRGHLGGVPTDGWIAVDARATRGDFRYFDDAGTPFVDADDRWRTRQHNDRWQLGATGRWRVGTDRVRWTLLDALVLRDEALPGPIGNPATTARLGTVRNLAVSSWEGRAGPVRAAGRLWHVARLEHYADPLGEIGLGVADQRDSSHLAGLSAEVEAAPLDWLAVGASAQGRWEGFSRVRLLDGAQEPLRQRFVLGAAADLTFAPLAGRLRVVPGVDVRGLLTDVEGGDALAVNPGLVLEGRPGRGVVVRASGGSAFRPPDLTELYGDRGAAAGNASLRPERAWKGDLGVRWEAPERVVTGAIEAAGFVTSSTDRITWIQNAQRTLVPVNFGQTLVGGVELATRLAWLRWVEATANLTWTESSNLTEDPAVRGRQLPFLPRIQLDHVLSVGWESKVRVAWSLHVTDGTFTDAANVRRQAARVLHGLRLEGAPWARGPRLELDLRNVGDRTVDVVARDPLGADEGRVAQPLTDFVGYPLPGITVMFTMAWTPGGWT